jgi:hypothetical protein
MSDTTTSPVHGKVLTRAVGERGFARTALAVSREGIVGFCIRSDDRAGIRPANYRRPPTPHRRASG